MTEAETARELYARVRRDSSYRLGPWETVRFVAQMMKRDPFDVMHAVGLERITQDSEPDPTPPT